MYPICNLLKQNKEIQYHQLSTSQTIVLPFLCQATRADKKYGYQIICIGLQNVQKSNNGNIKIFTATKWPLFKFHGFLFETEVGV